MRKTRTAINHGLNGPSHQILAKKNEQAEGQILVNALVVQVELIQNHMSGKVATRPSGRRQAGRG
jgi:hypothetical protein